MSASTVPLTPIAPRCKHWSGVWIGGEWRAVPSGQCAEGADVWLLAPDGTVVPGGSYCAHHAAATIGEYKQKLGEDWAARPLVFPCQHRRDPRLCAECRPHDLEADTPPERGDYECRRCGTIATYCGSPEEANEKLGPCPEWRCRYGMEHVAPCGPTPDPMYCACGCGGDDSWCGAQP